MAESSNLNTLALAFIVVMGALTFRLPRNYATVPLFLTGCIMPMGQVLIISGFNFHLFRILLFLGVLRVLARGEASQFRVLPLDKWFVAWVIVSLVFGTLVAPSASLFTNRLGNTYNAVGTYFFIRCVVREWADVIRSAKVLVMLSIPVALLMSYEKATGANLLSMFGGVPPISDVREGSVRAQGAFRHPILAGTFGAAVFPLAVGLWHYRTGLRHLAFAGGLASAMIVFASSSSGPLLALMAGIAGSVMWRFRRDMRTFRWAIVLSVLGLALVMKAPVWYLIARVSQIAGGTGWHRSYVIDVAFKHIHEWWLFGTTFTAHWGPGGQVIAADPNHMDITNHFIMEGVNGGILKLGLFIAIIVQGFKIVGRRVKSSSNADPRGSRFSWSLGVVLGVHCTSFISVPYFDQIIIYWYWLLGTLCVISRSGLSGANLKRGVARRGSRVDAPFKSVPNQDTLFHNCYWRCRAFPAVHSQSDLQPSWNTDC